MSTNFYIDKSLVPFWELRGPENHGARDKDCEIFIGKRWGIGDGLCAFKWATHPLELNILPSHIACIEGESDRLLTVPEFLEQVVKPCAWEDFDFSRGWS